MPVLVFVPSAPVTRVLLGHQGERNYFWAGFRLLEFSETGEAKKYSIQGTVETGALPSRAELSFSRKQLRLPDSFLKLSVPAYGESDWLVG